MIRSVEILNYKAFRRFDLELSRRTLIIGPNNAGKSSLISALKMVAYLTRPGQLRGFETVGNGETGVFFDPEDAGIDVVNLTHNYADVQAEIRVNLDESLELRLTLVPGGRSFASWYSDDAPLYQPTHVRQRLRSSVGVVPQVGPVEAGEDVLSVGHVKRSLDTHLSPRHFRNHWFHGLFGDFDRVNEMLRETVPSIRVYEVEATLTMGRSILGIQYREGDYAAEIAQAGHGIQVWLQLLSHFARLSDRQSVVLDEPDIYLHPDLQRRILQVVDSLEIEQLVVATHSVDILNEFDLQDVVYVEKRFTRARPLTSLRDLQKVTDAVGSVANSYYARLARANVALFVEGRTSDY